MTSIFWGYRRPKVTPLIFLFRSFLEDLRERFGDVGCENESNERPHLTGPI